MYLSIIRFLDCCVGHHIFILIHYTQQMVVTCTIGLCVGAFNYFGTNTLSFWQEKHMYLEFNKDRHLLNLNCLVTKSHTKDKHLTC